MNSTKSIFDALGERGFIAQFSEGLPEHLATGNRTLYVGFDPTADSLHLGNLVPILALRHFQMAGHRVLLVVGGATGMIGDPSGKSEERNLLTKEQIEKNLAGIRVDLMRVLEFTGDNAAVIVNNHDWISKMSFIDWLRDVGKHFNVNQMLQKDSVKRRIEPRPPNTSIVSSEGMSYTEFSYMTLQAFDFRHLFDTYQCTIQAGGSDQWGNITAGMELIHKTRGAQAHALTFPLLTTATGEKFGKSAGNAVWLNPERTSPYLYYQYWIRTDDRDIERYLKLFTFLDPARIREACASHAQSPERREGPKLLASEATRMIHGEAGLQKAIKASEALFSGEIAGLSAEELSEVFADAPSTKLSKGLLYGGMTITDMLSQMGVCKSKGEAKRLVESGGVYLNGAQVSGIESKAEERDLISGKILVLRVGKKRYHLASFD